MKQHTFAICAYKESPYLEACIRSLKSQTVGSSILLCTSTPCSFIEKLAEKYQIPLYVRDGDSDIQTDWNYAYQMADTKYVTIAHQDDMYRKDYALTAINTMEKYKDCTMFTTDCAIIKNDVLQKPDGVALVKKLLRMPLRIPALNHLSWVKKSALIFGNPIICPSCTYNKELIGEPLFDSPYKFALDWDTTLKLAERPGRFLLIEKPLMFYRIHEGAPTKACILDNRRSREEVEMFAKFWPSWVVKVITHFYRRAYQAYD